MCKGIEWEEIGVNINGEQLNHLRFADDIVLITDSMNYTVPMLQKLYVNSKKVELEISMIKTEIMKNIVLGGSVRESGEIINKQPCLQNAYKYVGHKIRISRDNQTFELAHRIGHGLFGELKGIFKSTLSLWLKRRVFTQCNLPVLTY
uniref:Reverse transcriptase domain-containing protein n=1 Tax=Dendroctonus ponderosae TaxID=77166 RepID=A0AAR5P990_DENPD